MFTFEHSGLANGDRKEQIHAFTASIRRAGLKVKQEPANWLDAFEMKWKMWYTTLNVKKIIDIAEYCNMLVSREKRVLPEALNAEESQFVAVYGGYVGENGLK